MAESVEDESKLELMLRSTDMLMAVKDIVSVIRERSRLYNNEHLQCVKDKIEEILSALELKHLVK